MYNETEIPPHKRKKGKKVYVIEERLTEAGAKRKIEELQKRMEREKRWHTTYTNYEKLKHAKQALDDINKKKKTAPEWRYYIDHEHRINEKYNE